jgi:ATP-dependent helicase/nuclease subunit B
VDRTLFGHLEVTDYKTGKSAPYAKLTSERPDDHGTRLQLPIYALAARDAYPAHDQAFVNSHYRFVSSERGRAEAGYVVDDDVLDRFAVSVGLIVDGIEQGLFPSHPVATTRPGFVSCRFCDPDGMGVSELDRGWQRKQTDPLLAGYRRLIGMQDPEVDVRTDDGFGDGDV